MVSHCANPECRAEFKFLNSGNLYAFEWQFAATEFFWLCSACLPRLTLYLDSMGHVAARLRSEVASQYPSESVGCLRLIYSVTGSISPFPIGPVHESALVKPLSAYSYSSSTDAA
jgi:hypothetical protein